MTTSRARVVPWPAVVQFHREVTSRARQTFFALPVSASAAQRWSPLKGFEPRQLAGPWELDLESLESEHFKRAVQTGVGEAFIGGPCWFRSKSAGGQQRKFTWIPLIYRGVSLEEQDGRIKIVPAQERWDLCPLVPQFLEQRNVTSAAPLEEMLAELLTSAQSKSADGDPGLTGALVEVFRSAVPELGEVLDEARDALPVDEMEFVPSPWILFTAPAGHSVVTRDICDDYARLDQHLAKAPHGTGGIRLLEDASGVITQSAPEAAPVVPLNDIQRSAVEAVLAKRPVTVISGPPGCGKTQVIVSILLNAWASSTSVLYASQNHRALDLVRQRLKIFDSDFEIAAGTDARYFDKVDQTLGRTHGVVSARRGESFYGGSPSVRKRSQLLKKKQILRELLDNHMPQQVGEAIQSALKAYVAYRKARSELESGREELASKLRALGVGEDPESIEERVLEPLRKWHSGIDATRRLIEEDALRVETLEKELSAALAERDSVLSDYRLDGPEDTDPSWLLAEPGFKSFEQAMTTLSEKLRDPIEDDHNDATWDEAYDAWSSSKEASDWERKAHETASIMRPASIALKEKMEELQAARETLEACQRELQTATKSSNFDARREDLEEWAARYAELCALPRSKLSFLQKSKDTELLRQLEDVESRFRSTFPPHLWTSIGKLDETGRERLSAVIERGREWFAAQEDWDRLSPIREEIEAETNALSERLTALGMRALRATEVTPSGCAAIASKLNDKASVAAAAAAAWTKREARERLPNELKELAAQIRAAGAGTPIKERWINGPGGSLMAALGAVESDPGTKTAKAVRRELHESAEVEPVLKCWRRAYEAEAQRVDCTEQLERIPPRTARLARWKSQRPPALPAELDADSAFDGDENHPAWVLLKACEEWRRGWAAFRDDEAPALQRTIDSAGAKAIERIGEAARALPPGKDRSWLESLASGSLQSDLWPVEKIKEKVAIWRPKRIESEIEKIDAQLERITFETFKDQWLERVAPDAQGLQSLDTLREHYKNNGQRIEEDAYAHFERSLKLQPVWVTTPMSTQSIPLQPGLFDLLIIDDAMKCSLTNMLPLIFRAKCLVVVGDPQQTPSQDSLGAETQRTLAARFGIEGWAELFGHVGNNVYDTAIGKLPGRKVEVISLADGE